MMLALVPGLRRDDGARLVLGVAGTLAAASIIGPRVRRALGSRSGVNVHLSRGMLHIDGEPVSVRALGKGMFTRAYVAKTGKPWVYLLVDEDNQLGDFGKEILASITRDERRSAYLPRTEHLGYTHDRTVYRMPLYRAPLRKSDSPTAWAQYRKLKECYDAAEVRMRRKTDQQQIFTGYQQMDDVVACARRAKVPGGLVRALDLLRTHAANYGAAYSFEFSPRNLATTASGHLILLDVVFSREAVIRRHRAAARRAEEARRSRWRGGW